MNYIKNPQPGYSKILLVGGTQRLYEYLKKKYHYVIFEENFQKALNRVKCEWVHLCVIYIDAKNGNMNPDALKFTIESDSNLAKLVVFSEMLGENSDMIRKALSNLERPSPAITVVSGKKGRKKICKDIDIAVQRHVCLNAKLQFHSKHGFFNRLRSRIFPADNSGKNYSELEDLFRILFCRCNSVNLEISRFYQISGKKIVNIWARPQSENIPDEHPLLIKCGEKEEIRKVKENYETFFFRMTPFQLVDYAETLHFAIFSFSAPSLDQEDYLNFRKAYINNIQGGNTKNNEYMFDSLFNHIKECWHRQTQPPEDAKYRSKLKTFYLKRCRMENKDEMERIITKIAAEDAPCHIGKLELNKDAAIKIQLSSSSCFYEYPNPVWYMYADTGNKINSFGKLPNPLRITHGNLKHSNIWIDNDSNVWIDELESMGWGPGVMDIASMEIILKFHCLPRLFRTTAQELYKLEKRLLTPDQYDQVLIDDIYESDKNMKIVAQSIQYIRREWLRKLSTGQMKEYYANLFFLTMKELRELTEPNQKRVRLHALFSAAMICHRLLNWENTTVWPKSKPNADAEPDTERMPKCI